MVQSASMLRFNLHDYLKLFEIKWLFCTTHCCLWLEKHPYTPASLKFIDWDKKFTLLNILNFLKKSLQTHLVILTAHIFQLVKVAFFLTKRKSFTNYLPAPSSFWEGGGRTKRLRCGDLFTSCTRSILAELVTLPRSSTMPRSE